MTKQSKLGLSEMVLLAIYRVANGSTKRVAFEEIVLQAWRDFPDYFSLENHPEHPDSAVVYQQLYAVLTAKRWIAPLRKKVLRLTEKALQDARQLEEKLDSQIDTPSKLTPRLNREEQEFIEHAFRSRAFRTWSEEGGGKLIDYDARVFLQFSTGTPLRERKRRLANAKEAIERAVTLKVPNAESLQGLMDYISSTFPTLFEEL